MQERLGSLLGRSAGSQADVQNGKRSGYAKFLCCPGEVQSIPRTHGFSLGALPGVCPPLMPYAYELQQGWATWLIPTTAASSFGLLFFFLGVSPIPGSPDLVGRRLVNAQGSESGSRSPLDPSEAEMVERRCFGLQLVGPVPARGAEGPRDERTLGGDARRPALIGCLAAPARAPRPWNSAEDFRLGAERS